MMKDWIDAKIEPPRKDIPILVVSLFFDIPTVLRWTEELSYPGFWGGNGEYEVPEEHIMYWMPCPKWPELKP